MSLRVDDQETTITFSRDGDIAVVYTSDTTVMTKLDKLAESESSPAWSFVESYRDKNGDVVAKLYKTDKKLISFRVNKMERSFTPEQKEAAIVRLQEYQAKRKAEQEYQTD